MNKSQLLLTLIEAVINPDDDYNKTLHHKASDSLEYYKSDQDYVMSTHKILSEEAAKHLKPTIKTTKNAKAAIAYSNNGYKNMNSLLRHNKLQVDHPDYFNKEQAEEHTNHLKSLTKNPTQHEFYAYRGMDMKTAGLEKARAGTVFKDHGFTSVSIRPETAAYFGNGYTKDKSRRNFRIHIIPGTKGHYLSGHNHMGGKDNPGEAEFALHPGTKFKIGKTHTDLRGHKFTDLHIHSQED